MTRLFLTAVFGLAVLPLGGCFSASLLEQSRQHAESGQPHRAFYILDVERRLVLGSGSRIDPEFERAWVASRIEFLLDRGRRYIFLEFEDEALVDFAAVLALSPGHSDAEWFQKRAVEKKALRQIELGNRYLAKQMLTEAMAAFLEADRILPALPEALVGQNNVKEAADKLTDRAQLQFLEAVRKLPEFRYVEVRWHSSNALANDPERGDADELRRRAQREIAHETLERGNDNKREGRFGAALIEYKSARDLDATLPGIVDLIAEMKREIDASNLAEKAQMHTRRMEFDKAREALDEAFGMSVMLRGSISELMIENRRTEGERDYGVARDFELQGMKREALEAFVLLSAKWPAGLIDEKERVEGLQLDIDSARKDWELALAAEAEADLAKALEHYQASERFYSRMADAKARIAKLKAQIAAEGKKAEARSSPKSPKFSGGL